MHANNRSSKARSLQCHAAKKEFSHVEWFRGPAGDKPLSDEELRLMDAWWRAANYLSVGQIYLLDNPLLKEPLKLKHIKPRLLGHWGTTPGLNFIYVHLNRIIKSARLEHDLHRRARPRRPGPGGQRLPGRDLQRVYPHISRRRRRACSGSSSSSPSPAAFPATSAPETPGSIHEGGELGYRWSHAYGAAFDNPDLIVACVVGDGEAETGPLATSWHSNKFLNPATDGAVLPILHLNGYKIANPTVLARIGHEELQQLCSSATATSRYFVEGDDPEMMHQLMAATLDKVAGRNHGDPDGGASSEGVDRARRSGR